MVRILLALSALISSFLVFRAEANNCIVYLSRVHDQQMIELTANRDGHTVGKMLYSQKDGEAYIGAIHTYSDARRTGVSVSLIGHMLDREAQTNVISAVLALDNYSATGLFRLNHDASLDQCIDAVKKSPLYHAVAKFGFVHVTKCVHSVRSVLVSVEFSL